MAFTVAKVKAAPTGCGLAGPSVGLLDVSLVALMAFPWEGTMAGPTADLTAAMTVAKTESSRVGKLAASWVLLWAAKRAES